MGVSTDDKREDKEDNKTNNNRRDKRSVLSLIAQAIISASTWQTLIFWVFMIVCGYSVYVHTEHFRYIATLSRPIEVRTIVSAVPTDFSGGLSVRDSTVEISTDDFERVLENYRDQNQFLFSVLSVTGTSITVILAFVGIMAWRLQKKYDSHVDRIEEARQLERNLDAKILLIDSRIEQMMETREESEKDLSALISRAKEQNDRFDRARESQTWLSFEGDDAPWDSDDDHFQDPFDEQPGNEGHVDGQ